MEFAKSEFMLDAKREDGSTNRAHYQSVYRQTGNRPTELSCYCPDTASALWGKFQQLHKARRNNGFGPEPIQYVDIDAWLRLTKQSLDHWELDAILELDGAYLAEYSKGKSK